MDQRALASAAANYPYLQGLWTIPLGFGMVVAGITNLERRPPAPLVLGVVLGCLVMALASSLLIGRHYRERYGRVTPTRGRNIRNGVAIVAWVVVLFVGANKYLLWSPDSAVCVFAAAFAVATLVYYAILVGIRAHHLVVWGTVFVVALVPVWGGADRDAIAMFPLAGAFILSGLLDQRLLARSFGKPDLEDANAGG